MASTLAPCLQSGNGTGEKPGHILHNGESAAGPADSPNQHYCIIIAFLSLLLSPAFSIPLAWSHSSHRVYLMGLWRATSHHYVYSITHTYTYTYTLNQCHTVSLRSILITPAYLLSFFCFSLLQSYFSSL